MKIFKKIAVLSSILVGSAMAQDSEPELDSQAIDQFDEAIYQSVDKNAADYIDQKSYGGGNYYLFYAASGATSINNMDYSYSGSGCVYNTITSIGSAFFDMPLQIPDGHAIRGFRYYWYDNGSGASSNAQLIKFDGAGGNEYLLTVVSSDTSGYGDRYANILNSSGVATPHIVDNHSGSYVVRFYTNGNNNNIRICGVRLFINSTP